MSYEAHPITAFDELVQLLDSLQGDHVVVDAGIEDSMCGLEGVTARGVLRRRTRPPWSDDPGLSRTPRYDLYHHRESVGDFGVDEMYFVAAELLVFHSGEDPARLFITQDVWRLGDTPPDYELPPHRLKLVVWLEDRLTFDWPARSGVEATA